MKPRLENALSITLTFATLVIAATLIHREFLSPVALRPTLDPASGTPRYVHEWASFLPDGITIGEEAAPVKVVVFSDLECPFCRRFHETFRSAHERFGNQISLVFVHFPLTAHRFARPAARAGECADAEGRFGDFLDVVFAKQDSLGLKSWASYAREASITDTVRFAQCASDTVRIPRIDAGRRHGEAVPVLGTPAVLVNGWLLPGTPSESQLSETIEALIAGREPFPPLTDG